MADPLLVNNVDVAVVGAGPCGLAAAIALEQAGIHAVVFDKSCLVSTIASYPTYLTFFSSADRLEVGGVPFTGIAGEKPSRREGLAYYRLAAEQNNILLRLYEEVTQVESDGDAFLVHTQPRSAGAKTTRVAAVVVATGYFGSPNMLNVPGENWPHVTHQFIEGHEAFGRTAFVVGGGNSAVECALELARCGAWQITLAHTGPTFSHAIKPWILPEFEQRVAQGLIALRWNTRVKSIVPGRVDVVTDGAAASVRAQHVYLMTGYTPTQGVLGMLGVPFAAKTAVPSHNHDTMETPVPGVFIAGVIASGKDANSVFIENGRDHGTLIAAALRARTSPRS